jgi:hypothetical protein
MKISFYFDATCPWTWITSRWLSEVALERNFEIEWLSLSNTLLRDEMKDVAGKAPLAHRLHRIIEAVRKDHGNKAINDLYGAFGKRWHIDGQQNMIAMEAALQELKLDAEFYVQAGDNMAWDAVLRQSLAAAQNVAAEETCSPLIVVNVLGAQKAFYGPIISSLPTLKDGLKLWDNLTWLLALPNFYQYKRPHDSVKPDIDSTHGTLLTI